LSCSRAHEILKKFLHQSISKDII